VPFEPRKRLDIYFGMWYNNNRVGELQIKEGMEKMTTEKFGLVCNKDILAYERQIAKIRAEDARNDEATKQNIARLKAEREATKRKSERSIAVSKVETGESIFPI